MTETAALALSPDGQTLAMCAGHEVKFCTSHDLQENPALTLRLQSNTRVTALAWESAGTLILGYTDLHIQKYNISTKKYGDKQPIRNYLTQQVCPDGSCTLSLACDSNKLAVGVGSIVLVLKSDFSKLYQTPVGGAVKALALKQDVLAVATPRKVKVFQVHDRNMTETTFVEADDSSLAWSPNGLNLAVHNNSLSIYTYKKKTLSTKQTLTLPDASIRTPLAWYHVNKIAFVDKTSNLKIYDIPKKINTWLGSRLGGGVADELQIRKHSILSEELKGGGRNLEARREYNALLQEFRKMFPKRRAGFMA